MIAWPEDVFWRIFESTGSIWAYLAYRRLTMQTIFLPVSLN